MTSEQEGTGGRFRPGRSGNPAGRPKGSGGLVEIRRQLAEGMPEAINTLTAAARAGDVNAAGLMLKLGLPPLKPVDSPAPLDLAGDASPTERVRAVVAALSSGDLSASQAAELLEVFAKGAGAMRAAESEERDTRLYGRLLR
jgi:hypothetical protein